MKHIGAVLDSHALLVALFEDKGHQKIKKMLRAASAGETRLFMGRPNWVEVGEVVERRCGPAIRNKVLRLVQRLPIQLVELEDPVAFKAVGLKARHEVSLGQAFAAALAQQFGLPLVTGDPQLKQLSKEIALEWLK